MVPCFCKSVAAPGARDEKSGKIEKANLCGEKGFHKTRFVATFKFQS